MEQRRLRTWQGFERQLRRLQIEREGHVHRPRALDFQVPQLLFRGHSNSKWGLETTLERYTTKIVTWRQYLELADATLPKVESLTGQKWQRTENESWLVSKGIRGPPPAYPYLTYLRHHGFPSPLLDWSESPYVAAFFAFAPPGPQSRAIYAFLEETGSGKFSILHEPSITSFGPYVATHSRHVLQQAVYTTCTRIQNGERHIADHEHAFGRATGGQDLLWKFILPASLRTEVLRRLDAFNLNAYSLFQTEEKMLETLALREIDFR